MQIQTGQGDGTPVHTIQAISESGSQGEVVDLNSVTEATLNSEGQIILTGEDGHGEWTLFMFVSFSFCFVCFVVIFILHMA